MIGMHPAPPTPSPPSSTHPCGYQANPCLLVAVLLHNEFRFQALQTLYWTVSGAERWQIHSRGKEGQKAAPRVKGNRAG